MTYQECNATLAVVEDSPAPMSDLDAIIYLESDSDCDWDAYTAAFQQLINSGTAWKLQGSYGRTASMMIREGSCTPKKGN